MILTININNRKEQKSFLNLITHKCVKRGLKNLDDSSGYVMSVRNIHLLVNKMVFNNFRHYTVLEKFVDKHIDEWGLESDRGILIKTSELVYIIELVLKERERLQINDSTKY